MLLFKKSLFTASTTVTPLKKKGKVSVEEKNKPESPKLGSKLNRIPKEKEPEAEVIQLKKIPVKPPASEKQVVIHKAEVTTHCTSELMVHGLHDREDRTIMNLGRTERVFTAEHELIHQFEEAQSVVFEQKTEKSGWTRTLKSNKVEEVEVQSVEKKKITTLSKAEEQKDSVKLKPFEKPRKPEEEPQKITLQKVTTKPKEAEKEVIVHKGEVTRHHDTELLVQKLHQRADREVVARSRNEGIASPESTSVLDHMEEREELKPDNEDSTWTRSTKALKDGEPDLQLTKKKIKKLPKKEEEQEVVTLKPFEKPQKSKETESPKPVKEAEAKTDTEYGLLKRGEPLPRDRPKAASKHKKVDDASSTTPESTQDRKDISVVELVSKEDKPTPAANLHETEETKKPIGARISSQEEIPQKLKQQQIRQVEKTAMSIKEEEKVEQTLQPRKPSISEKKDAMPPTDAERQTEVPKKASEVKKVQSRADRDKLEEKPLDPTEPLKKVNLKKTPSPKAHQTKPEVTEQQNDTETKQSTEKSRRIPKTGSPQDSGGVKFQKLPKRPPQNEATEQEKTSRGSVALVKEVSPRAVQMSKVPTQPEEEVLEMQAEETTGEEDEEAWGWELVPPEDWPGERVDGALETPGIPGGKRGETKAFGTLSSHLRQLI